MELREAVDFLEKSKEFIEWKKLHPHFCLAHGFIIPEESPEWQIGYSDGEKVVTFFLNPIRDLPEQECYKKPDTKVKALDKNELNLSFGEAKKVFDGVKNKKYSAETVMKTIVLVQKLEKAVYNITGLTVSLKTLNVKIGMDGKVIEESLCSLMQN